MTFPSDGAAPQPLAEAPRDPQQADALAVFIALCLLALLALAVVGGFLGWLGESGRARWLDEAAYLERQIDLMEERQEARREAEIDARHLEHLRAEAARLCALEGRPDPKECP